MPTTQRRGTPAGSRGSQTSFQKLLNSCQKAYEEAQMFDDWVPPDGTYACALSGFESGEKLVKGTNKPYAWFRLTFEILDGDFQTKTFSDFFSTQPTKAGAYMGLARLKRYAQVFNHGEQFARAADAADHLNSMVEASTECAVSVRTTTGENNRTYTNISVVEVASDDDTPGPEEEDVPATGADEDVEPPASEDDDGVAMADDNADSEAEQEPPPPPRGGRAPRIPARRR